MIRSANEVIEIAKARGFKFKLDPGPPPMPKLVGDPIQATDPLMQALKAWRVEIIEVLNNDRNP
jgi:hypothetical protein